MVSTCMEYKTLSYAFAVLAKLGGGVFFFIMSAYRGFPYRRFRLLDPDPEVRERFARELHFTPWCMLDAFASPVVYLHLLCHDISSINIQMLNHKVLENQSLFKVL